MTTETDVNSLRIWLHSRRLELFYVMLGVFVLWLGLVAGIFFYIASNIENIDPMMSLFTGVGLGGITTYFSLLIKDAWQFYWRKSAPGEGGTL